MDGERKKRKIDDDPYAHGDENREEENENVDKFFALIRSTRLVKERLLSMAAAGTSRERRREGDGDGGTKNIPEAVHASVPTTFVPEDFMMKMDQERRHRPPPSSSSQPPPPPPDLSIGLQSQIRAYDQPMAEAPVASGDDNDGGGDGHDLDLKLSL